MFASTRAFALAGALIFFLGDAEAASTQVPATAPVQVQTPAPAQPQLDIPARIPFDIPSQPLRRALEQFDTSTGISVLYPSELAEGRVSFAVRGPYTPDAALRLLIEGTGLTARAVNDRAFVLRPIVPVASRPADAVPDRAQPTSYDALVQRTVYQALCARPDTAMGNYRAALAVRIDGAGHIAQARLLDTTGDPQRDALLPGILQGVAVGAPPADTARPFVVLVLPRSVAPDLSCEAAPHE